MFAVTYKKYCADGSKIPMHGRLIPGPAGAGEAKLKTYLYLSMIGPLYADDIHVKYSESFFDNETDKVFDRLLESRTNVKWFH